MILLLYIIVFWLWDVCVLHLVEVKGGTPLYSTFPFPTPVCSRRGASASALVADAKHFNQVCNQFASMYCCYFKYFKYSKTGLLQRESWQHIIIMSSQRALSQLCPICGQMAIYEWEHYSFFLNIGQYPGCLAAKSTIQCTFEIEGTFNL